MLQVLNVRIVVHTPAMPRPLYLAESTDLAANGTDVHIAHVWYAGWRPSVAPTSTVDAGPLNHFVAALTDAQTHAMRARNRSPSLPSLSARQHGLLDIGAAAR